MTITDARHLDRIVQSIVTDTARITRAWLLEDADSCTPRAGHGGRSSNVASDPTLAIVDTTSRTRQRDHIASKLLHVHRVLADLTAELKTRTPTRTCRCCQREMATHGRDTKGNPVSCWACDRYLSRNGYPCDDTIHDDRPVIRMCDCPDWCCEPQTCPDRAAEGRSTSERCKKRMQRHREQRAS